MRARPPIVSVACAFETVTMKLADAELPAVSVAIHVTVVVPMANVLPEAGKQLTTGSGSKLSVALTVKVTTEPAGPVAGTDTLPGVVITGAHRIDHAHEHDAAGARAHGVCRDGERRDIDDRDVPIPIGHTPTSPQR